LSASFINVLIDSLQKSKSSIGLRHIFYVIQKEEKKWWTRLVKQQGKPPIFLKVDWDKWIDEDDEKGADMDFGDMDFSKLDMGGDDYDMDDTLIDDEEKEEEGAAIKKEEAASASDEKA
ncbi:uncharacterized protein OsI_027940-like, partial [Amborella trichopoda]|uniref:uncharacterized protein OsI_027940-like n=1 Tax=Amborella trichopoda TaxID=13333 RepID=UPI0009C12311